MARPMAADTCGQSSMRDPMITVRSRGRWKYSAASAVIRAVARKSCFRQRLIPGASPRCRSMVERRYEASSRGLSISVSDQREQAWYVGSVHVAEAGRDVGNAVVLVTEVVDREPFRGGDVRDRLRLDREDQDVLVEDGSEDAEHGERELRPAAAGHAPAPDQRDQRQDPAFAVVVGLHHEQHVGDGDDDRHRPEDERDDTEDALRGHLDRVWVVRVEHRLDGVERARPDVPEDHAERADSQGGPSGGAPVHTPIFADWRSAGVWRASRTGARSMVQPTAKMKNAEQTANTRRPRRNGVSLLTFAQTGLRPSTLQRRRSGRRM